MPDRISALYREIQEKQRQLVELQQAACGEAVDDYVFSNSDGEARLSSLFNGHTELIAVHNMGKRCPYCTLWGDGLNGLYPHLNDRAGFAVITPDPPAVALDFAHARGWHFPMYSENGSGFAEAMGFATEGDYEPGVSVFTKDEAGKMRRHASSPFGPGDPFCALWHLFDLLPGGAGDWQPKYRY